MSCVYILLWQRGLLMSLVRSLIAAALMNQTFSPRPPNSTHSQLIHFFPQRQQLFTGATTPFFWKYWEKMLRLFLLTLCKDTFWRNCETFWCNTISITFCIDISNTLVAIYFFRNSSSVIFFLMNLSDLKLKSVLIT